MNLTFARIIEFVGGEEEIKMMFFLFFWLGWEQESNCDVEKSVYCESLRSFIKTKLFFEDRNKPQHK